MDRPNQEAFILPSTSLVESKDGNLINLVQEGRLVQAIQPAPSNRSVQGLQTIYSSPTIEGVPYRQIFVKFEGPPSTTSSTPSHQRLILPNTLAPSTTQSAVPNVSTHYVIQSGNSSGVSSSSGPTFITVEQLSQHQGSGDHVSSSLQGAKTTYIIQPGEGVSDNSTILPVGEGLPLDHNNLTLAGIPLSLNAAENEDLTINTSSSTILNDGDASAVSSGLGLGQDALLSSNQTGLEGVSVDISHSEDDSGLPCVVDPKSFLNTDPTEKITDHKAFLNTTEKDSFLSHTDYDDSHVKHSEVVTKSEATSPYGIEEEPTEPEHLLPKVFSMIEATLSDALLKAIPGSKDVFLKQVSKEHNLKLRHEITTDRFIVSGQTVKILDMETSLNELLGNEAPQPPKPYRGILNEKNGNIEHVKITEPERADKAVTCQLLKPQYSRSGRELKWKTIEDMKSDEEDLSQPDDIESCPKPKLKAPKMIRTTAGKPNKRKRGRPRKVHAPENESSVMKKSTAAAPKVYSEETGGEDIKVEIHVVPIQEPLGESAMGSSSTSPEPTENEKENRYRLGVMSDIEDLTQKRQKPKKDYEALAPFKYFCNLCSFKTKRESHMKKHREIHKKGLPLLKCDKCDYTTLRTTHLRRHEMEHSSEFFHCPICKYKSDSKKLLARHYRVKHAGSQTGPPMAGHAVYSCEICDYKTTRLAQFQRHAKCHAEVTAEGTDSNKLVKSYICSHCPYKTTRKEHFLRHNSNVHSEKRPFLCDLCGKAFKRRDALKTHWLIHKDKSTRTYPFKCGICQKGFRCQAHLTEHQTIHSNIRAYLCEICGASFKTRTVQRKHVQSIHKNPRAYACTECTKRFNTRYGLRRHVKTHEAIAQQEDMIPEDAGVVIQSTQSTSEDLTNPNQQHIQIQIGDSNIIAELQSVEQVQMAGHVDDVDADGQEGHTIHTALIEDSIEQGGEIHIPITTLVQQAGSNETTTALLYLPNFASMGN